MQIARRQTNQQERRHTIKPVRQAAWVNEDAAWATMATGRPAINGRYGNFPESYEIRHYDRFDKDDDETRRRLETALEEWPDHWGIGRSEVQWIEYEALSRAGTRPHRMR